MSLPGKLVQAIEKARTVMHQHPQHDLSLGYRQAIWAALGPREQSSSPTASRIGLERRATLAIEATRYVLPIWQEKFPSDTTPQSVLAEAEQILDQPKNLQQARLDRGRVWTYFTNLVDEDENNDVFAYVGSAATQALGTAIYDEQFEPDNINYQLTDFDNDPDEWDAAFYAAAAYAHGPIWVENSNAAKRREFWEWWLNEAVPSAYTAIS